MSMSVHILQTVIPSTGSLVLDHLPFAAGEAVQVMIVPSTAPKQTTSRPLAGLPLTYLEPFEPVAGNDWEVLQ
jgi:hypothetical protein